MKASYSLLLIGGLAFLGLSACATEDQSDTEPALETPAETPATTPSTTQPAAPSGAQSALTVAQASEFGSFVADAQGRPLYLLEADSENESQCYDACAQQWPPFLAPAGTATVQAPELDQSKIGTIQRRDGSTQVTYAGHPLYHNSQDQAGAPPVGQDVTDQWGEWYLVTPDGDPLEGA